MDKEVKTYKDFNKVYIGESDMAKLVLVGVSHESGDVEASILTFGGDSDYSAYVIDENVTVPDHYHMVKDFDNWMTVYDDQSLTMKIRAKHIEVYRAGDYGCIIRTSNRKSLFGFEQ